VIGVETVQGHESVRRSLASILESGRVAHAYRFTGPSGVGKKKLALLFARAFLCPQARAGAAAPEGFGCGSCESCLAMNELRHPDLILYHDFQSIRWAEVERVAGFGGEPGDLADELASSGLVLSPLPRPEGRRWAGFTLDASLVFRSGDSARRVGNVFDPTRLAETLSRREEREQISPPARRLASWLYYGEQARMPYRGSLGIHLVARRDPQTPDRGSLRENLSRTSLLGGGKVAILDDAHRMTEDAQNALLKTLEEPPGDSLLMLVTESPGMLLPTVRSRTPEIACGRLAPEVVAGALEEQGLSATEASFLARWADGSLGRALEGEMEGLAARRESVRRFDAALRSGDLGGAMALLPVLTHEEEAGGDRNRRLQGHRRNLELLMVWYRDLSLAGRLGERAPFLNSDLASDILEIGGGHAPETWETLFDIVAQHIALLGPSSDFRLQGEGLLASLARALPAS
jgi:DNA polymerase III delta prime subunit